MRAMVLEKANTPLRLQEVPDSTPGPGQVLAKVAACDVCRTDLPIVDGDLGDPKLPLIPGHEIVGLVEAIGSDVTVIRVGDRVGIPWLERRPLAGKLSGIAPAHFRALSKLPR